MNRQNSMPLVSVITPTCSRPGMLERALNSLLSQTYTNFEVVIGDDNPCDSSDSAIAKEIVERFFDAGMQVTYFKTSGKIGAGKVRNIASSKANGEYLVFLDDDDEFLPDKLKDQIEFTLKSGSDLSFHDAAWYDENDKLVEYRRLDYSKTEEQEDLLKKHLLYSIAPGTTYMVRKEAFDQTDGWGEVKSGQDWYLMLRFIQKGFSIHHFPGAYVKQRLYAENRISLGQNKIDGENALYEEKKKYFPKLSPKERRYIRFRHYAVLAFATKRSRMYFRMIGYGLMTMAASPGNCIKEARNYFSKDGSIGL